MSVTLGPKELTGGFYVSEKVEKMFWFEVYSYILKTVHYSSKDRAYLYKSLLSTHTHPGTKICFSCPVMAHTNGPFI